MTAVAERPALAPASSRGVLLCLVSAVGFGVGPLFAKAAYADGASVATVLAARFAMAAVVLWLVVAWRRPVLPGRRLLLVCALIGAIGYAGQAGLYYGSLTRIDASLAALVVSVYPALVAFVAVVVHRRFPDRRQAIALLCTGLGLVLLLGTGALGGSVDAVGVLLVLGAAAGYAVYLTITAALPTGLDLIVLSAVVCTSAAASLTAAGAATGTLHAPASAATWGWIALLALCSTVIAVCALLAGVRALGASTAAILSCAEPAVTVAATSVVYGETLTAPQFAGGAAVLAAVLVLRWRTADPRP
jgi:drug/metabolite transporter (DMT)-like permease